MKKIPQPISKFKTVPSFSKEESRQGEWGQRNDRRGRGPDNRLQRRKSDKIQLSVMGTKRSKGGEEKKGGQGESYRLYSGL